MSDSIPVGKQRHHTRPGAWANFAPDELHWAVAGWAKVAPGIGGWHVLVVNEPTELGQTVLVAPPSPLADPLDGPRYVIAATQDGEAVLFAEIPGTELREIATFSCLSEALHGLCALNPQQESEADALAAATPTTTHDGDD